jgi:hypothetical protein
MRPGRPGIVSRGAHMHHAEWHYRAGPNGALCRHCGRQGSLGLNQRSVDPVANPMCWANGETDPRSAKEGTL